MNKPKRRQWALTSDGAEKGKSTFLSNAKAPIMVVDADGRFDAIEPLVDGDVLYPKQVINTLDLAEELIERVPAEGVRSIAWDSMTKLYGLPTRLGLMKNIQGRAAGGNLASSWVDKSNIMTVARDLALLGTDMYYVWHVGPGLDGTGKMEIRDMISSIEKDRLMTSINVTMEFFFVVSNGEKQYGVKVLHARDFGGRKANTNFVLFDAPGNYWKNGAEQLEELIYTPFASKEGAIVWAAETLGINRDEADGEYENFKEEANPQGFGEMFTGWYLHVKQHESARDVPEKEPEPVLPATIKSDPATDSRQSLSDLGAEVTIGNTVFAATTAWPEKFAADEALLALKEFPDLPEGAEIRMDRVVKVETGLSMFDWLGELEVELT